MDSFNAKLLRRLERLDRKIRFGSIEDVPEHALAQFYEQMFPERAAFLMRHWRWLYRDSAREQVKSPVLAIVGDRIVGQGGLVTVMLQRGDERREAVWMLDYAVLPEYQRGIVGGALLSIASSCCPIRMAFLNERSWALAEKMGWSTHFLTTAFQLPLRPERLPILQTMAKETLGLGAGAQVAGGAVRIVGRAVSMTAIDLDVLPANRDTIAPFATAAQPDALRAAKSADFLDWRVLSHPHADRYLVLKSTSVQAIARVMSHAGCRRLHLLTLLAQPDDRRGLSRFFRGVVRWALASDVDTILLVTSVPEIARLASRWLPVKSRQRFAFDAEDAAGRAFLGGATQNWELIDSDFEMMFESEA